MSPYKVYWSELRNLVFYLVLNLIFYKVYTWFFTRFITWFFTRFITRFLTRFRTFAHSGLGFPYVLLGAGNRNTRFWVRAAAREIPGFLLGFKRGF